jgi:hypothetical protein
MNLREQVRRDAEAFARLPKAEQANLNRELASLGRSPHLPKEPTT